MLAGESFQARHLFERCHAIEQVIIQQLPVLETMTPQDFLEFRQHLAPASGFQSVQFREVEFLSGLKDERYVDRVGDHPDDKDRLRRRLDEPSLWDGFCAWLDRSGLPMPAEDIEDLHREGWLLANLDRKRGGLGYGLYGDDPLAFFLLDEYLAYGNPSTAHCFQVHNNALMMIAAIGSNGTPGARKAGAGDRHVRPQGRRGLLPPLRRDAAARDRHHL